MCNKTPPFIIVVDVDNQRAYKAYSKGMNDLIDIWPQLIAAGEKADQAQAEYMQSLRLQQAARHEERKKRDRKYHEELDEYHRQHIQWINANTLFRGPKPTHPIGPDFMTDALEDRLADLSSNIKRPPYKPGVAVYQSIRDELQKMLNLAGAAIGPYRMMEGQVHVMIEWESGHRIQQLLDEIKEK